LNFPVSDTQEQLFREDISEYVAQLQLHMTLQARNLVPTLTETTKDSRTQMLQETQALVEKLASRQSF
jgi:23S rRNA pseudoU1915 N3-methylase RlmH